MKKLFLAGISLLLLACSTLSLSDLTGFSPTSEAVIPPTPNPTLIALYVQATVQAAQNIPQNSTQTPAAPNVCVQLPGPTCPAPDVSSPILPAPPTITVPKSITSTNIVSKSADLPTATATPTAAALPAKPYQIQTGTPLYMPNIAHQDLACNWAGVAGQVFDIAGNPAKNMVIVVDGKWNGTTINSIGMTGTTNRYGPGGYEIVLGSKPAASTSTLSIAIYGLDGAALSDAVPFNTQGDCQKNLTLINFKQVR